MTTIAGSIVGINGVISTDKNVLQNMQSIATAAGTWITYDTTQGKWAVVINRAGTSVASFDDTNIIGGITVSGKGVNELYNSTTIEFPHKDLRDQKDYIDLSIAEGERFANELDNRLNIASDLINDPIQAQYLATVELKQSRVDKVIQFRTDYSNIGLKAGDLIDVTADMYGYTSKIFRITQLEESDDDVLTISITALEYDADVYNTSDLVREPRVKKTGIPPMQTNDAVRASDATATATQNTEGASNVLTNLAIANALAAGVGPLFNFLKSSASATSAGVSANNPGTKLASFATAVIAASTSDVENVFNTFAGDINANVDPGEGYNGDTSLDLPITITLPSDFNTVLFVVECPQASYRVWTRYMDATTTPIYTITGINSTEVDIDGFTYTFVDSIDTEGLYVAGNYNTGWQARGIEGKIPMAAVLSDENNNVISAQFSDWQTSNLVFSLTNVPAGSYTLRFNPVNTYDLAAQDFSETNAYNGVVWGDAFSVYPQASGGGLSITVLAFKF